MGKLEDNCELRVHLQPGWGAPLRTLRHHLGDVDARLPLTPSQWTALESAAQGSDADLWTALAEVPGSHALLEDLSAGALTALRQIILAS